MNRIDATFKRLRAEEKKAFIPYVAAGDPDMNTTGKILLALSEAGADIIEMGIPFSDPLADGPTIQKAVQRSLKAGCTVRKVMKMVKTIRRRIETPLVFMTYYNIVLNYGVSRFVRDAKNIGADGIIVPDLPMEEADELGREARKNDFCMILLTAPTTPAQRFKKIAAASSGFVYYVSLTGVTGARKTFSGETKNNVKKVKRLTSKPVCVGFGISGARQAHDMALLSDGVIVGSAIIGIIEKNLSDKKKMVRDIGRFARSIAAAVHVKRNHG